jgi:hypothetical protein
VAASCAFPNLFPPQPLLAKSRGGALVGWQPEGKSGPRRWRDGSLEEDLPMRGLSELFNVNYFIVSQTNPHIVPILRLKRALCKRSASWALAAAFAAFSALQFQGVAVAPACGEGGDPFAALWAATSAAYGAVAAGAVCVALLARASGGGPEESPPALRAARALLAVCVAFFRIGYGALVGTAVAALACNAPAPLSVADYAATRGDGSLFAAAFGASLGRVLPNMTLLRAAAGDPVFAERAGLAALLAAPLPVPLLAADATVVCGEAAQSRARNAALALLALLAGALPCGSLLALFAAGRLKGLRRLFAGERGGKEGGGFKY